jgi:hypothetical protein
MTAGLRPAMIFKQSVTTKKTKKRPASAPSVINGFRVLFYSFMPHTVNYSRKSIILSGGKEIGPVPRLAIAESLRGKGFYVLHCNKNWFDLGIDGPYNLVSYAKRRAERAYSGVTSTWKRKNVTKRKARAIEREIWAGEECSFCGKIPPEFEMSRHSKKAVICNICVNETYYDFLESQQENFVRPPRGDYFAENGFDQIESYVSRMLTSATKFRHILIAALDGERCCSLFADGPVILVGFIIMDTRQDHKKEKNIRKFFASRYKPPAKDYLAQDGRVRFLDYPLSGNASELTAITKTILQELCGISPKEALSIKYSEK